MHHRLLVLLLPFFLVTYRSSIQAQHALENELIQLELAEGGDYLWRYTLKAGGVSLELEPPQFEIDGAQVSGEVDEFTVAAAPRTLLNGVTEYRFSGALSQLPGVQLSILVRLAPDNPVVRFAYGLSGGADHKLTKAGGKDRLTYLTTRSGDFTEVTEVRLSNYDDRSHSYSLDEQVVGQRYFDNELAVMGPLLVLQRENSTFLLAYEHGSDYGSAYLQYDLRRDGNVSLRAVRGNYLSDQVLADTAAYRSVWFELGGSSGGADSLAAHYRTFVLDYLSENKESRQPYIFYNTWGRQERVKWAGGSYLGSMNLEQTLREIERAHRMGIEVFVIDTGWYTATGDWRVNTAAGFFPDSLRQVKQLLDRYGMKLGLWFNPRMAALSSEMYARNKQYRTVLDGVPGPTEAVWETEESAPLCIVSPYWEDFADRLSDLVEEVGVSYFKWDAVWQNDCNAAGHDHGTEAHTAAERYARDGFLLPIYLSKIVDKVSRAHPATIFDFDVTEPGRAVGLSFLASGKYFAINNGPYYHNLDVSEQWQTPLPNGNVNVLVNPGPARGWYLRSVLNYDKWIPSVLFLTHYQPDEPRNSQLINLASLVLGQNGIWGNILDTSPEGTQFIGTVLDKYKQVRGAITRAAPLTTGNPGQSVEIHEKIDPRTGRGAVVLFGNGRREVSYVTEARVDRNFWLTEGVDVSFDDTGRAIIHARFAETSARIIFFGAE
ncbi:alpha-galactosidase [Neolewinella sp.]|uniref:alpha-galactosidase n=1 Tax=Neolewinella sp. TaxID=2993543 RepID=UPI003B51BCA3